MMGVFVRRGLTESPGALPVFVGGRWKWPAGLLLCALSGGTYLFTNHLELFAARELPLTAADRAIPFMPWTAWIYVSGALYLPAVFLLNRCVVSLNKHLYSYGALVVLSAAIFAFWPTQYPRMDYPIPAGTDALTGALLTAIRSIDRPRNCLPSLHVGIALLIALGFLEDRRERLPWILGWAIALSLSALTTKQHYIVDALAGAALALVLFAVFHLLLPYRLSQRVVRELGRAVEPAPNRD